MSVVVVGLRVKSSAISNLVNEINGKKVDLDSLGSPKSQNRSTYIDLMKYNSKILSNALKGFDR